MGHWLSMGLCHVNKYLADQLGPYRLLGGSYYYDTIRANQPFLFSHATCILVKLYNLI